MQLDDEVPLSGSTRTVHCEVNTCMNHGIEFEVAIELDAFCGPCGTPLTTFDSAP